jgi:hypothetical protein
MASRWWVHGAVLLVLAVAPALVLLHLVPLPKLVAQEPLSVAIILWLGLIGHAALTSLLVKVLDTRALGALLIHVGILGATAGMLAMVWPAR